MMVKISNLRERYLLSNRYVKDGNVIAAELEVEFKDAPDRGAYYSSSIMDRWLVITDGSLRNIGREFKSINPKKKDNLKRALRHLLDNISMPLVAEKSDIRTGYHIHCNVQHMDVVQVLTSIAAYWMVENCVSFMCGRLREGSLYCVRAVDGHGQVTTLTQAVSNKGDRAFFEWFSNDQHKYAGLNLVTLRTYGTLEYRMMRGFLDYGLLADWTDFCHAITYEHGYESPSHVLDEYHRLINEPYKFIEQTIKVPSIVNRIKNKYSEEEVKKLLFQSMLTIIRFAYRYCNTERWNKYMLSQKTDKIESPRYRAMRNMENMGTMIIREG